MRAVRSGLTIGATLVALGTFAGMAGVMGPGANGVIAYHDDSAVSPTVGSVTPDGAVQRTLGAASGGPAWAPSGLRLVFPFQTETSQIALFTAAADGSDRVRLADLPGTPLFPAWSPDGTKIAFALYNQTTFNYDIDVADADGTDPVQLTSDPSDDLAPVWSPDGSKIAFQMQRDGNQEIYVMDADGDPEVNVSNRPASADFDPDWSPDGSKLLFASIGTESAIMVMNPDGSGVKRVSDVGVLARVIAPMASASRSHGARVRAIRRKCS